MPYIFTDMKTKELNDLHFFYARLITSTLRMLLLLLSLLLLLLLLLLFYQ